MTNESREAFEAWAVEQPRVAANEDCFAKSPYGAQRYEFGEVQSLWLSWQAALQWAASQQAAEGWRPISEAPKEGRDMILLLTPSRFPQVAFSNTWWTSGFSVECKPTHWMPIPAAPTAQGERDE